MNSSVLVVGHPSPENLTIGADFVADFADALKRLEQSSFSVLVLPLNDGIENFLTQIPARSMNCSKVYVGEARDPQQLIELINHQQLHAITKSFTDSKLQDRILSALEDVSRQQQQDTLVKMIESQNLELKDLTQKLEERIQHREKKLLKAKDRTQITNDRVEASLRILTQVFQSTSLGQIETTMSGILKPVLSLEWVRLIFSSQTSVLDRLHQSPLEIFDFNLNAGDAIETHFVFARKKGSPFNKSEKTFLTQVAEGVLLSVERLVKIEQSESLKQQWEATFDSITEPLCLTDKNFTILRTNKAYMGATETSFNELIGREAFEKLLGKKLHNKNGEIKQGLRVASFRGGNKKLYQVYSHIIPADSNLDEMRLILFEDITYQEELARQMLESAKMAELGTIGSSIAHELNNPLGGIISFLQLIKMDMAKDSPHQQDLVEMLEASQRCKEIVENLLGFSRKPDSYDFEDVDLIELIDKAVKITELQTRSRGIKVGFTAPSKPIMIKAQPTLMAQAIRNILQSSWERLIQGPSEVNRDKTITVQLNDFDTHVELSISDNSSSETESPESSQDVSEFSPSLSLTLARKIIQEHDGKLEIISQPNIGTEAKISLTMSRFTR